MSKKTDIILLDSDVIIVRTRKKKKVNNEKKTHKKNLYKRDLEKAVHESQNWNSLNHFEGKY
jgi:hypothetical protein